MASRCESERQAQHPQEKGGEAERPDGDEDGQVHVLADTRRIGGSCERRPELIGLADAEPDRVVDHGAQPFADCLTVGDDRGILEADCRAHGVRERRHEDHEQAREHHRGQRQPDSMQREAQHEHPEARRDPAASRDRGDDGGREEERQQGPARKGPQVAAIRGHGPGDAEQQGCDEVVAGAHRVGEWPDGAQELAGVACSDAVMAQDADVPQRERAGEALNLTDELRHVDDRRPEALRGERPLRDGERSSDCRRDEEDPHERGNLDP